jgi:hypothetical protein
MANYLAAARSNSFRVTDPEAFKTALADLPIEVQAADPADPHRLLLLCQADGGWPSYRYDEQTDTDEELDMLALLAPHLADGEVAVLLEAGAEKLRAIAGYAGAVNNRGEQIHLSLEEIYEKAQALGEHIDQF